MTSITVGLDDHLAAQLAEEAARTGVKPEELAGRILQAHLAESQPTAPTGPDDAFAWIGLASSEKLRGAAVDELLAKGLGQSHS